MTPPRHQTVGGGEENLLHRCRRFSHAPLVRLLPIGCSPCLRASVVSICFPITAIHPILRSLRSSVFLCGEGFCLFRLGLFSVSPRLRGEHLLPDHGDPPDPPLPPFLCVPLW
jgi:hypothetical protein